MSSLQMVYVTYSYNVYGQKEYDIKTKDGNYLCRGELHNRKLAFEIAKSIDEKMVYERENGAGSMDFS